MLMCDEAGPVFAFLSSSFLLIYFVVAHLSHSFARYIVKATFNLFDERSDSKSVLVIK